jgi:hypothetical protein
LGAEESGCLEICGSAVGDQAGCNGVYASVTETCNVAGEGGADLSYAAEDARVRGSLGIRNGGHGGNSDSGEEMHD